MTLKYEVMWMVDMLVNFFIEAYKKSFYLFVFQAKVE